MSDRGITVLVPAYRSDQRLVRALLSLAAQTLPPAAVEVSFDGAPGYEPPSLPQVPGLRVHRQRRNWGWTAHVNRLLPLVSTPYFMVLPHDDAVTPGYLEGAANALGANREAIYAHPSVRNHGLRTDLVTTESIQGERLDRVREFLRRGPTAAELGWRGVVRAEAIEAGLHLRTRRSDGMFANTLWSLELLLCGESVHVKGEFFEKFTDPDGLSRSYHGRSTEERSRMVAESVANLAALLAEHGVEDPAREELLRMYAAWVLGLQGMWNVLADEPSSDTRSVREVRDAFAGFVANLASSLVTPARR
jgi:hypothetical protein